MHIAYQNVHLREYIISFHCIIFIWVHLDAGNAVRRGLLEIIVRSATPFRILSFLPWLMCAWYDLMLYMCLWRVLSSFQRCNPCIFRMCVVTSTSLQSGALGNPDFMDLEFPQSPWSVYLLSSLSSPMPCFNLPCSGPVACSFVAPKCATWSEISRQVLISLSLKPVCHMHFCHACLNLLMDELTVA